MSLQGYHLGLKVPAWSSPGYLCGFIHYSSPATLFQWHGPLAFVWRNKECLCLGAFALRFALPPPWSLSCLIQNFLQMLPSQKVYLTALSLFLPLFSSVLVSSGCCNKAPQSSGLNKRLLTVLEGEKSQEQGAGRFGVGEDPLPGLQMATFLPCPHMVLYVGWGEREKERDLPHVSCKGINPIMKSPPSWSNYLPKSSPLTPSH